jgi:lipopolysaccharide/colanic/teichoic acid biosynthesis glycosyltransferase
MSTSTIPRHSLRPSLGAPRIVAPPRRSLANAWLRRAWLSTKLRARDLSPRVRRAIDILVAGGALIVLAPLFLVVVIAQQLDDRGPIFFSQERIGAGGRRFRMWKLRTMIADADAMKTALAAAQKASTDGVRFKLRVDPRVTRVGRVLRKLSIDELPQLWNVVRGDMTIIGPRPAVWREVALYDARALRRLEVPQGLTCLWQVGGRSDLSFEQQVELDLTYIDKTSPKDEVKIALKTIPAVLSGKGAY